LVLYKHTLAGVNEIILELPSTKPNTTDVTTANAYSSSNTGNIRPDILNMFLTQTTAQIDTQTHLHSNTQDTPIPISSPVQDKYDDAYSLYNNGLSTCICTDMEDINFDA